MVILTEYSLNAKMVEKIRGKALEEKVEYEIQYISFMLLILFAVYVSYNDILKVFYE